MLQITSENQSMTHKGYFNATELVPVDPKTRKRTHKPAHFSDNLKVTKIYEALNKYPITTIGRSGGTWLPEEVKSLFLMWLEINE